MPRVVFSAIDQAQAIAFPRLVGVAASGPVLSRAVIGGGDRPILLWRHDLEPGGELIWTSPPVDHVLYVLDGSLHGEGADLTAGGAAVVEHGGSARFRAETGRVSLIHYHVRDDSGPTADRPGGHVHVVNDGDAFKVSEQTAAGVEPSEITMFADSGCETCAVWLSKFEIKASGLEAARHYHTEDEVMFVLDGDMRFGARELIAGGAIAIDRQTTYGFTVGPAGVTFLNFRPSEPFQVMASADASQEPLSERAYVRALIRTRAEAVSSGTS